MMSAIAIFNCISGSHPFQERRISLSEPAKIGRSVAQARPSSNNTIFDCKVLSRNHALLWYEGGKFFLQDTKSSNGTFVNSQRLSKGSEESSPAEIFSGDTIQFGVDVMENSRKVTHNCIIATVQLYHPNGQEAKSCALTNEVMMNHGLKSQELFQLAQCIQEASHREQALENKLVALQRLLQSAQESTEHGWQVLVDEDRLLSRLECLEDQLAVFAKGHADDSLRIQVMQLIEDKANYETAAKESLRRLLEEKLEVARKVADLERSLDSAEGECSRRQEACQLLQNELQILADKYEQQSQDLADITSKLQDAAKKLDDEQELKLENQLLQNRLEELIAHAESLQAENDFVNEQMTNVKAKLESMKSTELAKLSNGISRGIQTDLINLLDLRRLHADASPEKSDCSDEEDENVKVDGDVEETEKYDEKPFINKSLVDNELSENQLPLLQNIELQCKRQSTIEEAEKENQDISRLKESQLSVNILQNKLHNAEIEKTCQAEKIQLLEDELGKSALERASQTAKLQNLEAHVRKLQEELDQERRRVLHSHGRETCSASVENFSQMQQEMERESARNHAEFTKLKTECTELRQKIHDIELEMKQSRRQNEDLKEEYSRLQESYRELEQLKDRLQNNENFYHLNLTDAQKELDLTKTELSATRLKLSQLTASSERTVSSLKAELSSTLEEYSVLSQTARTLSYCATFPLVLLVLLILVAFHPFLSVMTATSAPT